MFTMATMPFKQHVRRFELCRRGGYISLPLQINGLIFMPEDQLRDCLLEKKEAGFSRVVLTFAGMEKFHDAWVGRRGEYKYLLLIARIMNDIGLERIENLFLTKSTIPQLEALMDVLDNIPGASERHIHPVGYSGWARNLEGERITPEILEQLPERVHEFVVMPNHQTEKEWISSLRNGYQDKSINEKFIHIRLREDNIGEIERKSCDKIIADFKERFERIHAALPELGELADMYGDSSNTRLYQPSELNRKWIERCFEDNPRISIKDYDYA